MLILAIETSCDETAIAVVRGDEKSGDFEVLSNVVSSQVKIHAQWGGVVPNLAAREHLKNIVSVLDKALEDAEINLSEIDLVAVTQGPGLIPALLIGTNASKSLAYFGDKPLLGIHHIEGHIFANYINDQKKGNINQFEFPILALVVSGGHTQLVLMKDFSSYEIVGQTQDEAAGEASVGWVEPALTGLVGRTQPALGRGASRGSPVWWVGVGCDDHQSQSWRRTHPC